MQQSKNRSIQKTEVDTRRETKEQLTQRTKENTEGDANKELARKAFNRGEKYINTNHNDKALAAFEQAIDMDPTNVDFYNYKGLALAHLDRYEEAIKAYEQAAHLDPSNSYYQIRRGDLLAQLKQYNEALSAYEHAIQLAPEPGGFWNSLAWRGKIHVLQQLGRSQEAQKASEQYEQSLDFEKE